MAKNVHVIPHMHWDREWYFTTEESRILLVNNMEEIMDMLEKNENYPYYILDGQTAILEDYFEVKPENKKRVKRLVQKGKLIVGPWYTQTDEMVVGGESIVRNLLYGLKDSKALGNKKNLVEPMMIGYLPDSFGQSEKLPQILNGFDIDRCVFWRGASERHGTNKHNFYWETNSCGRVLVHLLPLGYAIGKYLPQNETALQKRMDKYLPVLDNGAVNDEIVLPNGHDQMPIQRDIFEVIEKLEKLYPDKSFFLSKYEHVFDILEKQDNIDTIQGELLDGKYMRVHRSIFSTRADIKSSNTRIENKITNILEPLATIAFSLGFSYEHGLIESIWKEIMKNHAHDSIGCCCSDKVHTAIENRFFLAEDKTDELIKFYKRKIVDSISCENALDKLVVFNLLPYERQEVFTGEIITKMKNFTLQDENGEDIDYNILHMEEVDAGLIDRQIVHYGDYDPFVKYTVSIIDTVSALGYKTYLVKECNGNAKVCDTNQQLSTVENDYYQIDVCENGTLTIFDKEENKKYTHVLLIENSADDGDEYDFSPLADDFIVTSKDVKANISINKTKLQSDIRIKYRLNVPSDLDKRKAKVCDTLLDFCFDIIVKKNSKILDIKVSVNNTAKDHRVRVLIPNSVKNMFSVSDNQFGQIKRAVVDEAMSVWKKENWDERPDSIYPMLSYVALDKNEGLAVLTNSVREYELIGKDFGTIAITLFRSVGFLGKEELLRRPNRPSGIKLETPNSQMLGKQSYDFAIVKNSNNIATLAKEYTTPFVCYNKMPYNAMKLNKDKITSPYNFSLLNVSNKAFVMTALKKAEKSDNIILRGYQVEDDSIKMLINSPCNSKLSGEVNLNEDAKHKLNENSMLEIPRNIVKTYSVTK